MGESVKTKGIALNHIQPGKPTHNAYVERFKRTYHTEVLDCYIFDFLQEVRDMRRPIGCTATNTSGPMSHWG
ncbi:integrase core domain-containing protein [Curvibacter sp. APW13]|uniref:integrase core domain-containing protein n=1 Tax=Curvibacter sp. APW13 TaxID=3077236 RepID=UPI0039657686